MLLGCFTVMGGKTGLAGPAVSVSKALQDRPCLWSTLEVGTFFTLGALKRDPRFNQPATAGHTLGFEGCRRDVLWLEKVRDSVQT